jgi:hypothetical protein
MEASRAVPQVAMRPGSIKPPWPCRQQRAGQGGGWWRNEQAAQMVTRHGMLPLSQSASHSINSTLAARRLTHLVEDGPKDQKVADRGKHEA